MSPVVPARSARRWILAAVAVGLVVRLLHWAAVRDLPFVAVPIMDSEIYLSWARSITSGDWLAPGEFFLAPLYPYLLALILGLSGGSLDAVYLVQIAGAAVGLGLLARIGAQLGGFRLGVVAAFLAALSGPLVFHDVLLLKESLAATLVAALLWLLTREDLERRWIPWLAAGCVWGTIGLLRENAILLLPFLAAAAWVRRRDLRAALPAIGALLAGWLVVTLPFALRSQLVTGSPFPTFNAGFNLYIGNNPEADGTYRPIVAGKTIPEAESREPVRIASEIVGRPLSPGEASRYWMARSLRWAAENPLRFLALQIRKLGLYWRFYEWPDSVDYYWMREHSPALRLACVEFGGLALLAVASLWSLRSRWRAWAPVLLLVAGWTLATTLFFVFSRFRIPMLPALCLLAAVPVVGCLDALREGRRRTALAGAALVGGALLIPHLLGHGPDRRLVGYNLGGIYASTGDFARARAAYHDALEVTPNDFTVMLRLGDLALRDGRLGEAIRWYERATRARPDADDPWAQLGRALALGDDPGAAAAALEQASRLNPENVTALHGWGVLALRRGDLDAARAVRDRIETIQPRHPAAGLLSRRLEEAEEKPASDGARPR